MEQTGSTEMDRARDRAITIITIIIMSIVPVRLGENPQVGEHGRLSEASWDHAAAPRGPLRPDPAATRASSASPATDSAVDPYRSPAYHAYPPFAYTYYPEPPGPHGKANGATNGASAIPAHAVEQKAQDLSTPHAKANNWAAAGPASD